MVVFAKHKCAKFNDLTRQWQLLQESLAKTQPFTRHSVAYPTKHEVVALDPWQVQPLLVNASLPFYDPTPNITHV
jgi:hypothetical protein